LVLGERAAGREATRTLLAGAHLVNISDEWNAGGLLTVTGKAWTPQPVRRWCCVHATPV
jgi:hypothetical protein